MLIFFSYWIVFNNKAEPSRDLTTFIIPSISSLDIIGTVAPEAKIFSCIHASAAAVVTPNGIKTLLANGLIKIFY